jgi:Zn-dependent protease with chaperone function
VSTLLGIVIAAFLWSGGWVGGAWAQGSDGAPADSASVEAASIPGAADTASSSTTHRDYIAEVRANFSPESRAYWLTRTLLGIFGLVYTIGLGLLFLFTRWSAKLRDLAYRARPRYLRALIYLTLFSAIMAVFQFPLSWYGGFALEHQYALSNQSFGAWLGEQGKEFLVNLALFGVVPLLMLAYLAIEKSPRRWWLWLALGTLPLIIGITLIQPIFIDPLFNKFVPLRDQALKTKILALAEKADIPSRNVYEVDKSKQTKKYNAYVNGFGASQRIVLWDTTLQGMEDDEILFVMGHEMGHYKLAHIWKGILFYAVLSFGLFYLSWRGMRWAVARFGPRWGFTELHDLASLPLLLITVGVVSLVAQPLVVGFSRVQEHEADVFALEVTHDNDGGARAFLKLGSQNRSNPEPPAALKYFQYTHPPLIERIRFALEYRPWEHGQPNRAYKPRS